MLIESMAETRRTLSFSLMKFDTLHLCASLLVVEEPTAMKMFRPLVMLSSV